MGETVELELTPDPTATVLWLHGLGADGYDFEPVVPMLGLPDRARLRFVFPHAPVQPVSVNGGLPMRAWYDIYGIGPGYPQDEPGIRRAEGRLRELIAREAQRGIAPGRLVLAGFSQGGALALHTGLRLAEPVAGVVALSTWLPLGENLEAELTDAGRRTPILMMHGTGDTVVPLEVAERSRDRLQGCGCSVEWQTFGMPHTVIAPQLRRIGDWLRARLDL